MERAWIFADFKLPGRKDLDRIAELGFTDVVLGLVGTEHAEFTPKYSKRRIAACAEQVRDLGARVHVMAWVRRQRSFITACAKWMTRICRDTGAASGMLDAEGHWHRGAGISAAQAAELLRDELADLPCPLGVTGLAQLHRAVRPLLEVCDYGLPQAYSIWKPGAEHWSHSRSTEPGEQQVACWASWGVVGKPLVMGLSNYWAARPARYGLSALGTRESLERALDGARRVGATEVAYWSLKWLHGRGEPRRIAREVIGGLPLSEPVADADLSPESQPAAAQWLLVSLGYDLGAYGPGGDGVDGQWGTLSQQALDEFRDAEGIGGAGRIYSLDDLLALVNALRAR